jgi:Subtilase family/PA domain/Fibronectin type-III domain
MSRRLWVAFVALVLALVGGMIPSISIAGAADAPELTVKGGLETVSAFQASKSLSSQLAQSDPELLGRTDSTPEHVMVKLDYDAVASYTGGVEGLAATSPSVTGRELKENRAAVDAYRSYLADREAQLSAAMQAAVPSAEIYRGFQVAYGGVAMTLPANEIGKLLAVPGVVAVQRDKLAQPLTDTTPGFLGATAVWPGLGGPITAGEGVIVGVLDTGFWPEHPQYVDQGIDHPGGTFGCEFGDGSDPLLGPPFSCNDKLIGAYAFTDTYMALIGALPGEFCNNATGECSARDADGHGTHTSTTAVGGPTTASIFGISRGAISGMAPGAHLIGFRVCLDLGCFQSDSVAAVEQAILDGVDVINFSISGGSNAYSDSVELAFLDFYASGGLANASAGNAGPGDGTANHAGGWTNTVAASTSPRHWLTTLRVRADDGAQASFTGATITPGITNRRVMLGSDAPGEDILCSTPFDPGEAQNKIVVCQRGGIGRNAKSFNVKQGGAAGMILYNPTKMNLFTDNFHIPTVMLEGPEPANSLLAFLAAHAGQERARWNTGTAQPVLADEITVFSSRGPLGDWIKPDVTAPGIQILAGHTPSPHPGAIPDVGPPGQLFQSIAGTSMSSPHSAGVSALVKAVHPDWTPGQIKSALMTSSAQDVVDETLAPATPYDTGAGSIRANRAVEPTLTFDVPAIRYFQAAADPASRLHINLPSINVPVMPGSVTTIRRGLNVSGVEQSFTTTTEAPAGGSISVTPSSFTLAPDATQALRITIHGEGLADGQHFGKITLEASAGNDVVIPVAFFKQEGGISLEHSCDPTTISVGEDTSCEVTATNNSPEEADIRLVVQGPDPDDLLIHDVSPPGVPFGSNGFEFEGTLSPASAPTIDSITEGGLFGYLPLADFGVTPNPDLGDEGIITFGVPDYLYGSETYSSAQMTSNGYGIVGDGGGVEFVPQDIPDPALPNNTLAAFWTDLDQSAGGETYAAILTDGTTDWLVLEWAEVPTFSDHSELQSFQIWITLGATEGITYEYGDMTGSGDPVGLVVGAENRDGTSAAQWPAVPTDGDQLTVNTSPPSPGGSVTITYLAEGGSPGFHDLVASLTSNVAEGTTTEIVTIEVTP